jgi:DNA polymerase V
VDATMELFDKIVNNNLLVRRITVNACKLQRESDVQKEIPEQLDLFTDYEALSKKRQQEEEILEKERRMQQAVLDIKKKYGKNAILKAMNLEEGATAKDRNGQIGGHKA